MNGRGFSVSATPVACPGVWGAWRLTLTGLNGERIETNACDYQSAADFDDADNAFSVWF